MEKAYLFPADALRQAAYQVLLGCGCPHTEADLVATRLVKSNLAGHDSHGLIRLHQYMDWVRGGMIKPGQRVDFLQDHGSTAVLSGHRGFGQSIANEAMQVAISRAREYNLAAIGVTDLNHIGRLTDYVVLAAEQGQIALMFTSTGGFSKLVAPFGGIERRMSTNPFAAAFPSDGQVPVVFDFATSAYAEGKFKVMRDAGRQMPPHVLLDKEGHASTDPRDLYAGGAILPLGGDQGYKGYLLNFLVEVLGGLLTGAGYLGKEENPLFNNSSLIIVLNVAAYRALPDFKRELQALIGYLKASKTAPGEEVLAPGERETRQERERLRSGIPLAEATVEAFQQELDHFHIPLRLLSLGRESAAAPWSFGGH